jgi:hypothetical protein
MLGYAYIACVTFSSHCTRNHVPSNSVDKGQGYAQYALAFCGGVTSVFHNVQHQMEVSGQCHHLPLLLGR